MYLCDVTFMDNVTDQEPQLQTTSTLFNENKYRGAGRQHAIMVSNLTISMVSTIGLNKSNKLYVINVFQWAVLMMPSTVGNEIQ